MRRHTHGRVYTSSHSKPHVSVNHICQRSPVIITSTKWNTEGGSAVTCVFADRKVCVSSSVCFPGVCEVTFPCSARLQSDSAYTSSFVEPSHLAGLHPPYTSHKPTAVWNNRRINGRGRRTVDWNRSGTRQRSGGPTTPQPMFVQTCYFWHCTVSERSFIL